MHQKMKKLMSSDSKEIITGGFNQGNAKLPFPPDMMTLDIAVHSRKEALEEGTILIGEIGDNFYETVIHPFKKLAENRYMPMIKLIINSPGGKVPEATQLCYLIRQSPVPVVAEVVTACSAAFWITTQCHYRIGYPSSMMMYHLPWTFAEGNKYDMKEVGSQLEHYENIVNNLIIERCSNINKKILEEWGYNNETWINAEEAIKYGALDYIVEDSYVVDPSPDAPEIPGPDPTKPTTAPVPKSNYKKKPRKRKKK